MHEIKGQTVIEFHPIANVFPLIEGREFDELVQDIRAHGMREAIVLHTDGRILDGRNRYRASIQAGCDATFTTYQGPDPVAFVVSLNLRRRHLNESQRAMVAAKIANMPSGYRTDIEPGANLPEVPAPTPPVSAARAAEMLNVSERTVKAARVVRDQAVPELAEKVERGTVSVSAAAPIARLPEPEQKRVAALSDKEIVARANALKREQKAQRQAARKVQIEQAAASVPAAAERYTLHHASFIDGAAVEAESADFIITDPPYPAEYLDLFNGLGTFANHALKPGGLAVVMVGQTYLPEILAHLGRHLTYHWTMAYVTPGGQAVQQFPRHVNAFWKPVLIYSKGEYAGQWFGDVAKSDTNDNDKEHHYWGQSASGMRDIMRRFVRPNDLVIDPFLGGGTTAVVALEMGARFIGFDIDGDAIAATKARIGDINAALCA
jgi:DNA methylase